MSTKICKGCAEEIKAKAKVCPHCQTKQPQPTSPVLIVMLVVAGLMTCICCAGLPAPKERRVQAPGAEGQVAPVLAEGPRWGVSDDVDQMTDERSITIAISAEEESRGILDPRRRLGIRCAGGKLDIILVDIGILPHRGQVVTYRFDGGEPVTIGVRDSSKVTDFFFPPSGVAAFVNQITKARVLRLKYTPYNESPRISTFRLPADTGPVGMVVEACGG